MSFSPFLSKYSSELSHKERTLFRSLARKLSVSYRGYIYLYIHLIYDENWKRDRKRSKDNEQ
jgi:hypothetical protein